MGFSVFINFNGNCREAVTFYAKVFGQPVPYFMTYAEGDASFDPNVEMSEHGKDLVMNTGLEIAGTMVGFSDMPDNFDFIQGNNFMVSLTYNSYQQAKEIFDELGNSGQVAVPFDVIPGQGCYGMVTDRYGITWAMRTIEK